MVSMTNFSEWSKSLEMAKVRKLATETLKCDVANDGWKENMYM